MSFYFEILSFLFVSASSAASLCEPLGNLTAKVNYCDENAAYVPPARKCFQAYKALLHAENAKIQSVLNQEVKKAKGTEQETNFQTTEAVLASTIATLDNLLLQGKQIYNEIDDYSEDLVLPIYEAYPEDFDLDPHDPKAQQIFREKECYGEPMEDLDGMKNELRQMISELEATKQKSSVLRESSISKDNNLNAASPGNQAAGKTRSQGAVDSSKGKSQNKKSTITGVEEAKKKGKKL